MLELARLEEICDERIALVTVHRFIGSVDRGLSTQSGLLDPSDRTFWTCHRHFVTASSARTD